MFQKILLPTDGSESSRKAVAKGVELAKRLGARVLAVYVIDTSAFVALPETFMWESVRELLDEEGQKALEQVRLAAEKHGVEAKLLVREGSPAKEIVAVAEEENADLIVMGTAGRAGLGRFFLGSVSEKVLRAAQCPVMVWK